MERQTEICTDRQWAAVVARDRAADGTFYYGVKTTGAYCRPSCGSRLARRENVTVYNSQEDAERAGFRACRRCRPDEPSVDARHAAIVTTICRWIETDKDRPRLASLARRAGLSPHHFHRVFKAVTGMTPGAYVAARRAARVRDALQTSASVTDAIFASGFNSGSRFYAASDAMLGMTPAAYRQGGANAEIRFAVGDCSLGSVLVAQSTRGVCAIFLGDEPSSLVDDLQRRFPHATIVKGDASFGQVVAAVVGLVESPERGLALPLDLRGTAFQMRVWDGLRSIPAGSTISYQALAKQIGAAGSVRAVAGACAANPVAVAIPCHRVVRRDGGVSGYRWGIERKRKLIEKEAQSAVTSPAGAGGARLRSPRRS